MRTLATLTIALGALGAQCYAANFTGKLMDAKCYNEQKVASREAGHKTYDSITKTCAPTATSSTFALRVTGTAFHEYEGDTIKLDDKGNTLAADAIRAGTLGVSSDGHVHVVTKGKMTAGELFYTREVEPLDRSENTRIASVH